MGREGKGGEGIVLLSEILNTPLAAHYTMEDERPQRGRGHWPRSRDLLFN